MQARAEEAVGAAEGKESEGKSGSKGVSRAHAWEPFADIVSPRNQALAGHAALEFDSEPVEQGRSPSYVAEAAGGAATEDVQLREQADGDHDGAGADSESEGDEGSGGEDDQAAVAHAHAGERAAAAGVANGAAANVVTGDDENVGLGSGIDGRRRRKRRNRHMQQR